MTDQKTEAAPEAPNIPAIQSAIPGEELARPDAPVDDTPSAPSPVEPAPPPEPVEQEPPSNQV